MNEDDEEYDRDDFDDGKCDYCGSLDCEGDCDEREDWFSEQMYE